MKLNKVINSIYIVKHCLNQKVVNHHMPQITRYLKEIIKIILNLMKVKLKIKLKKMEIV